MTDFFATISIFSLLFSAFFLTRMMRCANRVEFILVFSLALATIIVLIGYVLSELNLLSSEGSWAAASLVILGICCIPLTVNPVIRVICLRKPVMPNDIEQRIRRAGLHGFETRLLLLLGITVAITSAINFVVCLALEPSTPDVLDYHLARIAYYLQYGNLHYFPTGYWAMVCYPKVATVLQLYSFLLSGKNGSLSQLIQFIAYFVSMLAVYGIARQLGGTRKSSLFSAFLFAILIICLMEAVTAQNDMILTAFLACSIYFLLAYRASGAWRYIPLISLSFALLLGVKFTFVLTLPSLLVIAAYCVFSREKRTAASTEKHLWIGVLSLLLALSAITLPAGYWDNYRLLQDPFGPKDKRAEITSETKHLPDLITGGALNLARYGVDMISLDGFPPVNYIKDWQKSMRQGMVDGAGALGMDLTSEKGASKLFPFTHDPRYLPDDMLSMWGILGFTLIWPLILACLAMPSLPAGWRIFAVASILFYIVQAFITQYDPFRGRFFIMCAIFAVPPAGLLAFRSQRLWAKVYLTIMLTVGCISALCAVCIRNGTYVFPFSFGNTLVTSSFTLGRSDQLTRQQKSLQKMMHKYELYVPKDATVAVEYYLRNYLFFGDGLTRKLKPIRSFQGNWQPIPPEADYLIYSPISIQYQQGDLELFKNHPLLGTVYLRNLKNKDTPWKIPWP